MYIRGMENHVMICTVRLQVFYRSLQFVYQKNVHNVFMNSSVGLFIGEFIFAEFYLILLWYTNTRKRKEKQ